MDTNAQNTLVIIFQNVDIFCAMLDHHADSATKTAVGFQIAAFERVVDNYLNLHVPKDTDRQRILNALSINNMDDCGLLSYIDDRRGQFSLQQGLLQTIQNLDSKRIRELGQPDLDIIYAQVRRLYDYFIPMQRVYNLGDSDFRENLSALFDVLQGVLTKIDHNVRALEGSSKRLSEVIDSHDFNQKVMTDRVRSAIEEVIKISKRNIRPTLIFLNEKAMTEDTSAMRLIRSIRESFEDTTFHIELANISTIEMKLLSYAEVIADIRRRMNRYVEMDRKQRELYNNIERHFNALHAAVVTRLDSKLHGKKIPALDPLFNQSRAFRGLNNWSSGAMTGALIDMPPHSGNVYVNEYIRAKMARADAINSVKRKPSSKVSGKDRLDKSRRVVEIKKSMYSFSTSSSFDDLYMSLHIHLQKNLRDYQLQEIFDALYFIKGLIKVKTTLENRSIVYREQKLTYLIRKSGERDTNAAT